MPAQISGRTNLLGELRACRDGSIADADVRGGSRPCEGCVHTTAYPELEFRHRSDPRSVRESLPHHERGAIQFFRLRDCRCKCPPSPPCVHTQHQPPGIHASDARSVCRETAHARQLARRFLKDVPPVDIPLPSLPVGSEPPANLVMAITGPESPTLLKQAAALAPSRQWVREATASPLQSATSCDKKRRLEPALRGETSRAKGRHGISIASSICEISERSAGSDARGDRA